MISSPENTNATEPASGGSTEYINHHLHHLQVSVGDGAFMTLNVDTLFFTGLLSLLFLGVFLLSARRATAGVPKCGKSFACFFAHSSANAAAASSIAVHSASSSGDGSAE